jgi:hypothetical protein
MPSSPQDVMTPVLLGVTAFTAFMPALTDVRHSPSSDSSMEQDLRVNGLAASIVVVLGGGLVAYFTREWYPLWIALATVALMVALYECVFRMPGVNNA